MRSGGGCQRRYNLSGTWQARPRGEAVRPSMANRAGCGRRLLAVLYWYNGPAFWMGEVEHDVVGW